MSTNAYPPARLKTAELVARIHEVLGVKIDVRTISAWAARPHDPLPTAFRARRGQSHEFEWADAGPWLEREFARTAETDYRKMDLYAAKTSSAQSRARMDEIELAALEGRYGDLAAMEQMAEDCARQAVNRLMALPSRLAPRLALMTDELAIDRLLDDEIRTICAEIEAAATTALGADPFDEAPPEC